MASGTFSRATRGAGKQAAIRPPTVAKKRLHGGSSHWSDQQRPALGIARDPHDEKRPVLRNRSCLPARGCACCRLCRSPRSAIRPWHSCPCSDRRSRPTLHGRFRRLRCAVEFPVTLSGVHSTTDAAAPSVCPRRRRKNLSRAEWLERLKAKNGATEWLTERTAGWRSEGCPRCSAAGSPPFQTGLSATRAVAAT